MFEISSFCNFKSQPFNIKKKKKSKSRKVNCTMQLHSRPESVFEISLKYCTFFVVNICAICRMTLCGVWQCFYFCDLSFLLDQIRWYYVIFWYSNLKCNSADHISGILKNHIFQLFNIICVVAEIFHCPSCCFTV